MVGSSRGGGGGGGAAAAAAAAAEALVGVGGFPPVPSVVVVVNMEFIPRKKASRFRTGSPDDILKINVAVSFVFRAK